MRRASSASACRRRPPTWPAGSTRPAACSSTSRAASGPSRRACRCRSATASWPRPPTPSSACPRSSPTGCRRAGSTSGSSAAPSSTASATSTRRSSAPYDTPRTRLPGAGGAPEIAASAGEVIVIMRQNQRAFVERCDFRHLGRLRRRAGRPRAARAAGRRAAGRHHRPRRPRARPRDVRAGADRAAPRRAPSSRRSTATGWPLRFADDARHDRRRRPTTSWRRCAALQARVMDPFTYESAARPRRVRPRPRRRGGRGGRAARARSGCC